MTDDSGGGFGGAGIGPFGSSFVDCQSSLAGCGSQRGGPPSGVWYGWLWLNGMLPSYIHCGPNDHGTAEMRRSTTVQVLRRRYIAEGCPAVVQYQSGHDAPAKESARNLIFGNTTQFEVGGVTEVITSGGDGAKSVFTIFNISGWSSFLGLSTLVDWGWVHGIKSDAWDRPRGPGANVVQTFTWKEANPCHR